MNFAFFWWYPDWTFAATLPEKPHKDASNKSEQLADAFLPCSDERNPPCCQATHLKWRLLQERGKKVPASLIEARILQCKTLDNLGSGSWLGQPSRCELNGPISLNGGAEWNWIRRSFLLSGLWPTRQWDGWDAIRTFFCLQLLCVPSFLFFFLSYLLDHNEALL